MGNQRDALLAYFLLVTTYLMLREITLAAERKKNSKLYSEKMKLPFGKKTPLSLLHCKKKQQHFVSSKNDAATIVLGKLLLDVLARESISCFDQIKKNVGVNSRRTYQ